MSDTRVRFVSQSLQTYPTNLYTKNILEMSVAIGNSTIRGIRRRRSALSEIKMAVVGSSGVGKSALIVRFLTKRYIGEYDSHVENTYKTEILLDGDPVLLEILDTCPKNEDVFPTEDVLNWADGYMLVYSVTDRRSFDYVRQVRHQLTTATAVPVMIVANKEDLVHLRQISFEEGEILAKDSDDSFVELAASEQIAKICQTFYDFCREIHCYRRRSKQSLLDRMLGNKAQLKTESFKK